MVVGAGNPDHLADPEPRQRARVGTLVLRREVDPPGRDDQPLAGHEPGHRELGPDRPRIRQGHRGAGEVVREELVRANAADDVLVGTPEPGEVEVVGALDVRHEQRPAPVVLLHIDGEAQVHLVVSNHVRHAVGLDEALPHPRYRLERAHDRPPDEVREAHLPAPAALEEAVDDPPVLLEELRGDDPERGRGGELEARLHVADDALAAEAELFRAGRHRRRRLRGPGRGSGRGRRRLGRAERGGEVREEVAPGLADLLGILAEPPVHLVDEPHVRPEGGGGEAVVRAHVSPFGTSRR